MIIGFGIALIFFIVAAINSNSSDGIVKNLNTIARGMSQEKGQIIFPKTEEMDAMEATFEANDKEGVDTPIGEIESDEMS